MRDDRGFTLMEILVAVVIFGFIMAGISQATRFGITAWAVQSAAADRAAQLERLDRTLRLIFEQAAPPLAADDRTFMGQEHRVVFTTRFPDQPLTEPIRRVQLALGVNGKHQLIIRWQYHPNATALGSVPPPQEIVLAEGIDHIDLTYRQALSDGGKWLQRWDDASLPALVQIHVVPQSARLHWPAFQIATMIDTNGSF